jgi:uncharacterized SAM-binding protein YcdF (DUF218 family)
LIGGLISAFSFISLFVLSVPLVGKRMLITLEAPYREAVVVPGKQANVGAQAIVILGGGRYSRAPEYDDRDTVGLQTLERLRYGARLAAQTSLPVLLSGGSTYGEEVPETQLMQQTLEQDYGVKAKWLESSSRTTLENAQRTKLLLTEAGIKKVYLVTHAWHMDRAVWAFVNSGIDVVPAPVGFTTLSKADLTPPLGYLPSSGGMEASATALHERFGLYWYKRKLQAATAAQAVKEKQQQ